MSLHFEALAPNLWSAKCRGYAMNTGILHDAGLAALIDPALLPDEVEDIATFCEAQQLKVETVVLTHHHWDHVLGAARFSGAHVVAQQAYAAQTALDLEHTRRSIRRYEESEGIAADVPFDPPVADQTVEHIIGLMVGDVRVQLFHTPGHAGDHLSMYDPNTACLWAGDLLSDLEIPFVSDRLDAYERTLGMFAAMEIHLLVPGHGSYTRDRAEIKGRIDADRSYLSALRTRVEAVVRAGGTVDAAVAACAGLVFRDSVVNVEAHVMNVEQVFLECGGSAPPTPLLGWPREL
jgi:glyoxylase-like metal-dependent hydrolase (beta-lactamase superfamily II)